MERYIDGQIDSVGEYSRNRGNSLGLIDRQIDRQIDFSSNMFIDRQIERQIDRKINRQKDKQIDGFIVR